MVSMGENYTHRNPFTDPSGEPESWITMWLTHAHESLRAAGIPLGSYNPAAPTDGGPEHQ